MKKTLSIIITVVLITSIVTVMFITNNNEAVYTQTAPANRPDWVITEICPDQAGNGVGGWSAGNDCAEFIEIYNNSGSILNLYDYCLTYNGNTRTTTDKFETQIVEITPFKPGDYLDGWTAPWPSTAPNACGDLSNKPVNPATCTVAPGEVVVLWIMYVEAYYASWNSGKGLSVDDFRTFWNIPANVKVIAVDGNGDTSKYGGNDKNFNIKNSGVGTYGIALYSDALNTAANTTAGADAFFPVVYTESPELSAWATVDFTGQLLAGSLANATYNYTVDNQGFGAFEWDYKEDSRRMVLLEPYASASVGTLTTMQKLTLGAPLDAGESITFGDGTFYIPDITTLGAFKGFVIGETLYPLDTTFTASAAGVYNLLLKFENDTSVIVNNTVETTAGQTTVESTTGTTAVTGTTNNTTGTTGGTNGTTGTKATTTAPSTTKKGCRSAVGIGLIAFLIPAAFIVSRKKRK